MNVMLETKRMLLREMSLDDLDFISMLLADPEVMRFYPQCYSRDEAAAWIRRQMDRYAKHGHGLWLAVDKVAGTAVGQVGLIMQSVDEVQEVEVGYLIHKTFWRTGLATEAAIACRDHAFTRLNRERVISLIRPENLPSQGVARKLGMQEEKRVKHGGFDHIVFALEREAVSA